MKHHLFTYLICAGAFFAVAPALTAQQKDAGKPAITYMDNKEFNTKLSAIDKTRNSNPAEAFAAYMKFTETKNLNDSQRGTLFIRAIQTAFPIKDAEAAKKACDQLAAAMKTQKNTYVLCTFVNYAYRVKNDPYRADIQEIVKKISAEGKENDIVQLISTFTNSNEYYGMAEDLYKQSKFTQTRNIGNVLSRLAIGAYKNCFDQKKAQAYMSKLLAEVKKAEKKNEMYGAIQGALNEFLRQDYKLAQKIFADFKAFMPEDKALIFEFGSIPAQAKRTGDNTLFKAAVKKAIAMPFSTTQSNILSSLAYVADDETACELFKAELKNPALTPRERFRLYEKLRSRSGNVRWFQRFFVDAGSYGRWRKCTDELIKINNSTKEKNLTGAAFYYNNAYTAFGYGDFKFSLQQLAEAEKLVQGNQIKPFLDIAVMIRLWQKDAAAVSKLIALNNVESDNLYWRVVDFFSKGGKMAKFDDTFEDDKLTSEAKLLVIRRASELFYRAKRYEVCRDIYNDTLQNQFISLEPKKYEATFIEDPPRTADGFMRTKYSQRWRKMETRFVPYGENPNSRTSVDVKRFLKDTEKPQVDPEWKTGIFCAYDTNGLHIYIRGVDPGIEEVMQGKRDAGVLEFTFRPHADAPYHMLFFEQLPYAVDNINLEYASPTPRYRRTQDTFITDSAPAKDGFAAHVYIPWITFYENLPLNGKCWYMGLQRWCKGGGQTISGQAHELARMLNIQFDISKKQERAIKRNICFTAFNRFKNSKTLPVWKTDIKLGDPEFYEKELAPIVAELEEAGKLLNDEDADIDAIFDKYVAAWAEFEFTIAEKRRLYLKKKFFE